MAEQASSEQPAGSRKFVIHGSLLTAYCWLVLNGCAPHRVVVNPAFDFSKVRRISVAPFDGPGGAVATDEFVKELVETGIEVTDAKHAGDVILRGMVTEYKPNMQLMVFLGDDNPVITAGAQVTPEAAALGAHRAQVASVISTVGIQARLMDASTHSIVWADSFSYEGLDLPTALDATIGALTRSLKRAVPSMNRPKPA
jgi:hypothetical protein